MNDSFQGQENISRSKADYEISLKEIILKIQEWWGIVWSHKLLIFSLSLILGFSSALYTKFLTKPKYTASYQLFFQDESGGLSSAMRLASSIGIGGIGGSGASSSATVQEFITSRNNIAHTMNADLDGSRLIDRYHAEAMEDDNEFASEYQAYFNVNRRYTDSLLTEAFLDLNKNVLDLSFDEKTGVLNFSVTSDDELFTHDLATNLVKNTEAQFKDWKREKTQKNVLAFQGKVDSLKLALDLCLKNLGEYQDQNNLLVNALDKMEQMRLTIDLESLKISYGEYLKALEVSKAELTNLEGPFKYFDDPIFPLKKEENSPLIAAIYGSSVSSFLLVLFLIGRVEAAKIMAD